MRKVLTLLCLLLAIGAQAQTGAAKKTVDEIREQYASAKQRIEYNNSMEEARNQMTATISHMVPVERADLEARLKVSNHIETSDSSKIYLLQITDKNMRGEAMPIEYARPQIEKILINARQVDFLHDERQRMYEEAVNEQKLKFYER